MAYEDKILDFLAQSGNLGVAMQVAEYVQKLTEKVHQDFWTRFDEAAMSRLNSSEHRELWVFSPFPPSRWATAWGTCSFRPIKKSSTPLLQVPMQQETKNTRYRLLLGVEWSAEPRDVQHLPAFDRLATKLRAMNLTFSNQRWPGWNTLDYQIHSEKFILRAVHEPEALVNEIAGVYWQFFLEIRSLVEEVNREVQMPE